MVSPVPNVVSTVALSDSPLAVPPVSLRDPAVVTQQVRDVLKTLAGRDLTDLWKGTDMVPVRMQIPAGILPATQVELLATDDGFEVSLLTEDSSVAAYLRQHEENLLGAWAGGLRAQLPDQVYSSPDREARPAQSVYLERGADSGTASSQQGDQGERRGHGGRSSREDSWATDVTERRTPSDVLLQESALRFRLTLGVLPRPADRPEAMG